MILILSTVILLGSVKCDEIITLKDKNRILCVTDNTKYAISIEPPVIHKQRITSIFPENWSDGWVLKNSSDVVISKVIDKRWEDFEVIYTDKIHFESVASLSFSRYGSGASRVIMDDVDKTVSRTKRNLRNSWAHFTNWPTNTSLRTKITLMSDEKSYWKIHRYKLRWAETISQEPTTIFFSPNDASCIMLYMYTCANCTLSVKGSRSESVLHGKRKRKLAAWKLLKLESESLISLLRNTTNGEIKGQWGIDIRRCPATVSNRTIFDVDSQNSDEKIDRQCKTLFTSTRTDYASIFKCDVGKLGEKCNLECKDLLGLEHKYCEKHWLCDSSLINSECFCSWGYHGQSCNTSCSTGSWGLSCEGKCSGCKSCNPQTGDCTNGSALLQFNRGCNIMVLLGIGMVYFLFQL